MKTIYIVQGHTGEYDDYRSWLVTAYLSEHAAQTRLDFLKSKVKEMKLNTEATYDLMYKKSKEMKQFDPDFKCDYTGTCYEIITLDLCESKNEVEE
jgi:hypothetical protein